jgi:hypothetical protein
MGIRKRGEKWLVTAEAGRDVLGVRRRVTRTVDTEEEAKHLDVKLQHDIYSGRHVQPSHEHSNSTGNGPRQLRDAATTQGGTCLNQLEADTDGMRPQGR